MCIRDRSQTVHTSLVQTTTAAQLAEFVDYENRPEVAQGGFDHKGPDGDHCFVERDGSWIWSEPLGQVDVETKGFVGSEVALANGLVCEHLDSPGWGALNQVGQLIKGAGPHPTRAPNFNEHEVELRSEFG